ncbi:MAG: peptidylprolyl isomerase [Azospirillaceae bacterium]|nr:peptidylprolyl isomerase [Azospirillaceae bacterium]
MKRPAAAAAIVTVLAVMITAARAQSPTGPFANPTARKADQPVLLAEQLAARRGDIVVARIDGQPILVADLIRALPTLPMDIQYAPAPQAFARALDVLIERHLLITAAVAAGTPDDPEVARLRSLAEQQIVTETYLQREVARRINFQVMRDRYEAFLRAHPYAELVHARHIETATREQAEAALSALRAGADFGALADRVSIDHVQPHGDLGLFSRDDVEPAIADAAFALAPGHYSDEPVKGRTGYHILLVESRRTSRRIPFEEGSGSLPLDMAQEAETDVLTELRREARIERFAIDGTPEPDPQSQPAFVPIPAIPRYVDILSLAH